MNAEVNMAFPIQIYQENGNYVATLLGAPEVRTEAMTREGALADMQCALEKRIAKGELVFLEVPEKLGILAIAGKYKDDPTLADIRDEIYRQRDAEPKE
jgi:predicted RNase H-like HicB family nuclease